MFTLYANYKMKEEKWERKEEIHSNIRSNIK